MKTLLKIGIVFILLFGFSNLCKNLNTSNSNVYIIHSKNGDIKCNYHNSRDLVNDWLVRYYNYNSKQKDLIPIRDIDSITVLKENFFTRGPKNDKIKYIYKN